MSDHEPESGEDRIDESGRNATQQRIDQELAEEGDAPVGVEIPPMREDKRMSETIPQDPDRDGEEPVEEPAEDDEDEPDESA